VDDCNDSGIEHLAVASELLACVATATSGCSTTNLLCDVVVGDLATVPKAVIERALGDLLHAGLVARHADRWHASDAGRQLVGPDGDVATSDLASAIAVHRPSSSTAVHLDITEWEAAHEQRRLLERQRLSHRLAVVSGLVAAAAQAETVMRAVETSPTRADAAALLRSTLALTDEQVAWVLDARLAEFAQDRVEVHKREQDELRRLLREWQ
jgi:hypothetical protein